MVTKTEKQKPEDCIHQQRQGSDENQTFNIEIDKYKSLHDILDSPPKVGCAILAMLILTVAIFTGIGVITIALKRMYPYNNIKTNALGATTMQSETKEITYWLFNSAELWANTGIKVKASDVLTIRASGKSHTAIHHLVQDAEVNRVLRDKWVGTSGEVREETRDLLRGKYRIFKNMPQNALIMQVVPENIQLSTTGNLRYLTFDNDELEQSEKANFYYIGNEKVNLRINNDGVLHFAVNDIVLTRDVINEMINANNDSIRKNYDMNDPGQWSQGNKRFFNFGPYPDARKTLTKDKNEMTYYQETNYYNAWFDDNIGSFLIIIEREK